jgi:hypothetical protein
VHYLAFVVRLVRIGACQFQHADAAESFTQPSPDPLLVGIGLRWPWSRCWVAIDRFAKRAGDRGPAEPEFTGDAALTLATLCQELNRAAFHLP